MPHAFDVVSLLEHRDAVALAMINREQSMFDLAPLASLDEVRSPYDVEAYRGMAGAALRCLHLRGWVPPPGGV